MRRDMMVELEPVRRKREEINREITEIVNSLTRLSKEAIQKLNRIENMTKNNLMNCEQLLKQLMTVITPTCH